MNQDPQSGVDRDLQAMHDLMLEWHEQRGHQGSRMSEMISAYLELWKSGGYDSDHLNLFRKFSSSLLGNPREYVVPYKIEYLARCALFYRSHGMGRASGRSTLSGFRLVEDQEIDTSRDLDVLMLEHAMAQVWLHRNDSNADSLGNKIRAMFRWREKLTSLQEIGWMIAVSHALKLSTARHLLASQDQPSEASQALSIFLEESRRGQSRDAAVKSTATRMVCSTQSVERYLEHARYGVP